MRHGIAIALRLIVGLAVGLPLVFLLAGILAIVGTMVVFGVVLLFGVLALIGAVVNPLTVRQLPRAWSANVTPFRKPPA